ncbi:MAG: hypothetical protein AAF512_23420, partial [Pseudomonadota bacterium]
MFDFFLTFSYFVQGTGFNEAFYYHFNEAGIIGQKNLIAGLLVFMVGYFLVICYLTFKVNRSQTIKRAGLVISASLIILALLSPQSLTFGRMYLDAHNSSFLDQYFSSNNPLDEKVVEQLVKDEQKPFQYSATDRKNLVFIYALPGSCGIDPQCGRPVYQGHLASFPPATY